MSLDDIDARKAALRQEAQTRRRALAAANASAGPAAAAQLLNTFPNIAGATIALYWPIRSELDARPLLNALATAGAQTCLPAIETKGAPLAFRRYAPGDALSDGPFSVQEPRAEAEAVSPQIVVAPLLAFDATGGRLGYGGGYYDRTLAALRTQGSVIYVGYGFSGQEVAVVPTGESDARLDWMVTERSARRIVGAGGDLN